jgi:sec-independent protein translocase protein TatA
MKTWHIVVLLVIVLLLFGARRLPELSKSVGQSLKIFKSEMKDLTEDDQPAQSAAPIPAPQALPTQPAPVVQPAPVTQPGTLFTNEPHVVQGGAAAADAGGVASSKDDATGSH